MEAIREIRQLDSNQLTINLPDSFAKAQVEVVVLRMAAADDVLITAATDKKRWPSPLLAGTHITGDIMSAVVPDADWEALS